MPARSKPIPRSYRRRGEIDLEDLVFLPFALHLYLAVAFRKWLRRRIGRRAGNVLGQFAILVVSVPPLVVGCVLVLLLRRT